VELRPGRGGQLARSAGAFGQLAGREGKYAVLKHEGSAKKTALMRDGRVTDALIVERPR